MTRARQLLRGGQSGRTRAHHRHALPAVRPRRLGLNPAVLEGVIDDGAFNPLDAHWRRVNSKHACRLARSGADASGELRKIVGGVQGARGLAPAVAIDQIVPVRDQVVQGATGVTKGHAAIHAAGGLRLHLGFVEVLINFKIVVDAL